MKCYKPCMEFKSVEKIDERKGAGKAPFLWKILKN